MTPQEAIERLDKMQSQIIHGSRIFGEIADVIRALAYHPKLDVISREPMEILDWVNYETRAIKCSRCGSTMPNAPWPTNSVALQHRPRCGACASLFTYPVTDCAILPSAQSQEGPDKPDT